MTWDDLGVGARALAEPSPPTATSPTWCSASRAAGCSSRGALGYALGVKNTFTMNVEFYTGIDERLEHADDPAAVPDLVDFADTRC